MAAASPKSGCVGGSDDTHKLAQVLVALRLSRMYGSWTVSGDEVVGRDGMAVIVAKDPCSLDGLLFGFRLCREESEPVVIWDCAHRLGRTLKEKLERAIESLGPDHSGYAS